MRKSRFFAGLLKYPFTYLVLVCIGVFHTVVALWFAASGILTLLLIAADLVLVLAAFILFLGSSEYRDFLERTGSDEERRLMFGILNKCPAAFGRKFREAVDLIDLIKKDFATEASHYELDSLLANLGSLLRDTAALNDRSGKYGNDAQRAQMKSLLDANSSRLDSVLSSLKTLSGNLTLIDSDAGAAGRVSEELKAINTGLSQALEELNNEKNR